MRAVLQRVLQASVESADSGTTRIGPGLLVLVGIVSDDTPDDADALARRLVDLRIFDDDRGRLNRSVLQAGGSILLVPNFTLAAHPWGGRRPSFDAAMPHAAAGVMFADLARRVAATGVPLALAPFGASMRVSLVNDGPVTLVVDTRHR